MFYLLSFIALAQIHLQHRNEPIAHARRLLLLAMAIQFAKYIAHAFADIDMHLYHGYSYLPNAINVFVEEIVVMLLGMSLIATVRLKRTPRLHAVLLILPIVICMPLRYIFDTVNVSVIAFAYTIIMAVLIIIHVCLLVRRSKDLLNPTFADTTPHAVTWVLTTLALLTLYFIVWLAIVWLGISALYTQPYKYLYIRIFYLLLSIIPWTATRHPQSHTLLQLHPRRHLSQRPHHHRRIQRHRHQPHIRLSMVPPTWSQLQLLHPRTTPRLRTQPPHHHHTPPHTNSTNGRFRLNTPLPHSLHRTLPHHPRRLPQHPHLTTHFDFHPQM